MMRYNESDHNRNINMTSYIIKLNTIQTFVINKVNYVEFLDYYIQLFEIQNQIGKLFRKLIYTNTHSSKKDNKVIIGTNSNIRLDMFDNAASFIAQCLGYEDYYRYTNRCWEK